MTRTITCADCGDERHHVQYRTTKYCNSCRLFRDLRFMGDRTYECAKCAASFAPVTRGDKRCGDCTMAGSMQRGECLFCRSDAELQRSHVFVCVNCVRDPAQRDRILDGLQGGQRKRRLANGLDAPAAAPQPKNLRWTMGLTPEDKEKKMRLLAEYPRTPNENLGQWGGRLVDLGVA